MSAEGIAASEQCLSQFPLAQLEIAAHGYRCAGCARSALVRPLPANLKVGRGRLVDHAIVFAVGGAFVFIAPAVALIATLVVAALTFHFFVRWGL